MKNNFNLRLVNCARTVVFAIITLNGLSALAQCAATNALTIPNQFLGSGFNGDGNFNAIVLGNYNSGDGGTDGRLAVAGNFTLNSSSTGYKAGITASSPVANDNFVVGGVLTNRTGKQIGVRGNFTYGSVDNQSALPTHGTGEGTNIIQADRIIFTGLKQHYVALSNDYGNQPSTSSPDPIISDGNIVLTGNNTVTNYVFNVSLTSSNLSGVTFVNIPTGSGILINILNANVTIAASETPTPMSDIHRLQTLFNFPNATSILLNSFSLEGSVLAPKADFYVQTGRINGPAVIGGNVVQSTGFSFHSYCLAYPLPVRLTRFTAKKESNLANLDWQTTSETNAEKFIVQRSKGENWMAIGEVDATGESSETLTYTFTDAKPLNGNNLYRLKMLDRDETFTFSKIVSLKFDVKPEIKAYPNPVTELLYFEEEDWKNISHIQISTMTGKKIPLKVDAKKYIDVKNWQTGLYLVQITAKDGSVVTQKILKNQ